VLTEGVLPQTAVVQFSVALQRVAHLKKDNVLLGGINNFMPPGKHFVDYEKIFN
jgi:hypothetical protein